MRPGNYALALVPVELAAPLLIPAAAVLTPRATTALRTPATHSIWKYLKAGETEYQLPKTM